MTSIPTLKLTVTLLVSLLAPAANAQLALPWYTIDGGGGMSSTGGTLSLSGTVGQPDAGVMTGGGLTLTGGFWGVAAAAGVPTPTVVSAVSRKRCDLPLSLLPPARTSEPRQGGITEVCFEYDGAAPAAPVTIYEDPSCPLPPDYVPYAGASVASCVTSGRNLCCTFTPGLENARAYLLIVPSGAGSARLELRGLTGDVTSDGQVNAGDRSAIVGVWTGSGFSCTTDINSSGQTDAGDRSAVVGAWTGAQNCAP